MSKTLDTKIKILKILNKKPRTVTQISEALGLAQSTVSQHIDELKVSGAIMEFDDSNNRKWKYYKVNKNNYNKLIGEQKIMQKEYLLAKKIVIAFAIIGILAVAVASYLPLKNNIHSVKTNNTISGNTNKNNTIIPVDTAMACPIIFANQTFNTTLAGYSGMKYYNNSTAQFVLQRGNSGIMYLNISKPERSSNVIVNNSAEFIYSEVYNTTNMQSPVNVAINETNGVIINFNRSFEDLTNTITNERLKVTINAESNATQGTYRVILPEGPCKPNELYILLTIGNKPYNGIIKPGAIIYDWHR